MTVIRTWEADLSRRLNIGGLIDFDKTTIGKTLHVPCAVGEHLVDFKVRANLDPNGAVKQMINAGWTVGRRRLVCPDCVRKSKEVKQEHRIEREKQPPASKSALIPLTAEQIREKQSAAGKARQSQVTMEQRREWGRKGGFAKREAELRRKGQIPAAPTPTFIPKEQPKMAQEEPAQVAASDKARAAKRAAMEHLSESFNVERGTFAPGVSDASIAKDTGLAEAGVKKLREEFFGPLGEPDELRALREELSAARTDVAALKQMVATGEQTINNIGRRIETYFQKQGWPLI